MGEKDGSKKLEAAIDNTRKRDGERQTSGGERVTLSASDVQTLVVKTDDSLIAADIPSAAELVEKVTPGTLKALLARLQGGELEIGEQYVSIEDGMQITGTLLRQGETQLPDLQTEEGEAPRLVDVKTWHFLAGNGLRFSMIGAYMTDRQLPAFMGREVTIMRLGSFRSKRGRIVTRYTCFAEKATDVKNTIDVQSTERGVTATSAASIGSSTRTDG